MVLLKYALGDSGMHSSFITCFIDVFHNIQVRYRQTGLLHFESNLGLLWHGVGLTLTWLNVDFKIITLCCVYMTKDQIITQGYLP